MLKFVFIKILFKRKPDRRSNWNKTTLYHICTVNILLIRIHLSLWEYLFMDETEYASRLPKKAYQKRIKLLAIPLFFYIFRFYNVLLIL